jgi:hypothetical protein
MGSSPVQNPTELTAITPCVHIEMVYFYLLPF